jgi:inner membrane protein
MKGLSLLLKAVVIGFLMLAILIPLEMIRGTIAERQSYRQQAIASVAQSYAGAQTLAGPIVVVPYLADVPTTVNDANGVPHTQIRAESRQWTFFPKSLHVDGELIPDEKHRGIHTVQVYELDSKFDAHFDFTVPNELPGATIRQIGKPYLSIGIGDVRGLIGTPNLSLNGHPALLLQGGNCLGEGVHADLSAIATGDKRALDVAMDFRLGGTERLAIAPIGDSNHVELRSKWPHPGFEGRFSPQKPEISAAGFHAVWDISALAANTQGQYADGDANAKDGADRIELTLVDPVSIYTQVDRASKYGLLFVLLTFVGFFMFETIKRLRIHPIQYLLVGLALAIFFLLLISLSEHIAFVWAYLVASAACIGLLGFYLSHVLHSRVRGLGFATMLTVLYAVLYGLLVSEDNALVLGSLMLFAILAAIMTITRRIDWYRLGQDQEPEAPRDYATPRAPLHERASEGY